MSSPSDACGARVPSAWDSGVAGAGIPWQFGPVGLANKLLRSAAGGRSFRGAVMRRNLSVVGLALLFGLAGAASAGAQDRERVVERQSVAPRAEAPPPMVDAAPPVVAAPVAAPREDVARPVWSGREAGARAEQHARPSGGSTSSGGGRVAVPRGGGPAGAPSGGTSSGRGRTWSGGGGGSGHAQPVGPYSRPRDGRYATGTAVARGSVPPNHVYPPHWNGSWWYPYYPYGLGVWGLGWYYWDPYYWGGWGWGPYYGGGYYGYDGYDFGSVRLKVKPRDAEVFVDGYYVGIVDEFDGSFQQLRIEEGPHVIQIRKEGFRQLEFKVRVLIDHTVTLRGELQPGELPVAP